MKSTNQISLWVFGLCLFLGNCGSREVSQGITESDWKTMEVINDLEDAKEWMLWDVEEGRIDSSLAHTYLLILDESITTLQQE